MSNYVPNKKPITYADQVLWKDRIYTKQAIMEFINYLAGEEWKGTAKVSNNTYELTLEHPEHGEILISYDISKYQGPLAFPTPADLFNPRNVILGKKECALILLNAYNQFKSQSYKQ